MRGATAKTAFAALLFSAVGAAGPLHLEAPAGLVLGRDRSAVVTLKPPTTGVVRLTVNVGSISQPSAAADGLWRATYTPPREAFPQVAILAATDAQGSLLDWTLISLEGQGELETKAEPRSTVRIQVGPREYGPFNAGASGFVATAIEVPPGVTRARVFSTDTLGNTSESFVPLDVPPYQRLLGLCPASNDRMLLVAVDPQGRPSVDERFQLRSSLGTMAAVRALAPGVYEAALLLPDDAEVGARVLLTASGLTGPASTASCSVTVEGGAAREAAVTLTPSRYVAGSGQQISVVVEVRDAQGRPGRTAAVVAEPEPGWGDPVRLSRVGPGRYEGSWRVPDAFAGKDEARMVVRAEGTAGATAPLALVAGPVTRVTLNAVPDRLVADGKSELELKALASDAFGNPVRDAQLVGTAGGAVTPFVFDEAEARHRARYVAPSARGVDADVVVIRDARSGSEARAPFALARPFGLTVAAQLGVTANLGRIVGPMVGAEVSWRSPLLGGRLGLGLGGAYAFSDSSLPLSASAEQARSRVELLSLLASVRYRLVDGQPGLFVGVAGGAVATTWRLSAPSAGDVSSSSLSPAASGLLGADLRVPGGRIVLHASVLHCRPTLFGKQQRLNALTVSAGYGVDLW